DFYSLQNQVTEDTPDTFLWHCCGDDLIDVSNSLEFASVLHEHGVDTELHIYSDGAHGISNANHLAAGLREQIHPQTEGWLPLAINWVRRKSGFNEKVEALF
ncbi:MAG: prolyl oligopeptidase family serine peptidase, partial [Lachnospiraceae bacterium]|nr:prolyl oligopeptidase family serine peptidase [Lachnospiraceae bacterium]